MAACASFSLLASGPGLNIHHLFKHLVGFFRIPSLAIPVISPLSNYISQNLHIFPVNIRIYVEYLLIGSQLAN